MRPGDCPVCLLRLAGLGCDAGPAAAPTTADLLPADFGDFAFAERLGRGPRGEVFRAVQLSLGRTVAVKFLDVPAATAALVADAADRLAGLAHGLVPVFEAGVQAERPWYAMPVAAATLAGRLAAGPPPPAVAARWFAGVAAALHGLHRLGLAHGRLTPANVLFLDDADPAVADAACCPLPPPVPAAGELPFLAPELRARAAAPSPAADVFSLGALLAAAGGGADAGLDALARHCRADDPARRPVSALAVVRALEGWLATAGDDAGPGQEDATPLWI
jgi:serine/threonine protein kinase